LPRAEQRALPSGIRAIMKFRRKDAAVTADPDMTPMIDMTFQLIAFFMVLLNFGDIELDSRINLPASELAKPQEAPPESPLVLQLTSDDRVVFNAEAIPISALDKPLFNEKRFLELNGIKPADATVIIRADSDAKTGIVQEVIQKCQDNGFEKFALRARQEEEKIKP
jgi:biopolymer transport protein ExbD